MTSTGRFVDLDHLGVGDIDATFWTDHVEAVRALAAAAEADDRPDAVELVGSGRLGPPIARPGKIVCVGLNYRRHATETGAPIPSEPVLFLKPSDVIVGPHDDILVPRGSTATDYEVELGVVIGRTARYLDSNAEALECIGGYVCSHAVSERDFQLNRGGQWDKGKGCETFNPVGPYLVSADEVPDPQRLRLWCWVNDELRQEGSTADMIFTVAELIRYISQFMVLYPGDLINTGTPAGVALGLPDPKPYLRAGDTVELEVEGLGHQTQCVRPAP